MVLANVEQVIKLAEKILNKKKEFLERKEMLENEHLG